MPAINFWVLGVTVSTDGVTRWGGAVGEVLTVMKEK